MIKYKDYYVVFEEIPDKITLAVNITNCQNRCIGCHSPELRENIGKELTTDEIDHMIKENDGINCFLFMGEGNDLETLVNLAKYIKENYQLSVALYSGREKSEYELLKTFDFIKIGPYIEKYGPLNKETTNQRLYHIKHFEDSDIEFKIEDITGKFWRNGIKT
jgi:anaerobic ribonucleoside-triphosphate reductase activating protein